MIKQVMLTFPLEDLISFFQSRIEYGRIEVPKEAVQAIDKVFAIFIRNFSKKNVRKGVFKVKCSAIHYMDSDVHLKFSWLPQFYELNYENLTDSTIDLDKGFLLKLDML